MKFWLGELLVAPVWGWISTQLFVQGWLSCAGLAMGVLGLLRGRVARKDTLTQVAVGLISVILWFGVLRLGFWVLTDILTFGFTPSENVVYWIFAAVSALYMLPQMPTKLRNSWHFAMTPGFLERTTLERSAAP